MRIAVIDIGNNSVRILVAETFKDHFKRLYKQASVTRIGQGVRDNGFITESAMDRTIKVIDGMVRIASVYRVDEISCIATSPLRDAQNAQDFIHICKNHFGINVNTISGQQEAALSYLGAVGLTSDDKKYTIIDIGGGSTEIVFGKGNGIISASSYNIGAVKLKETFNPKYPVDQCRVMEMNGYLDEVFAGIKGYGIMGDACIGVGGTVTSLAALDQGLTVYDSRLINDYRISFDRVVQIGDYLLNTTLEQKKAIKSMQRGRADIIAPGTLILRYLMKKMDISDLIIRDYDSLEGYIIKNYMFDSNIEDK
ncbi:MAG: hypothetical protein ACOYEJ_03930 [Mahellales bacterium]